MRSVKREQRRGESRGEREEREPRGEERRGEKSRGEKREERRERERSERRGEREARGERRGQSGLLSAWRLALAGAGVCDRRGQAVRESRCSREALALEPPGSVSRGSRTVRHSARSDASPSRAIASRQPLYVGDGGSDRRQPRQQRLGRRGRGERRQKEDEGGPHDCRRKERTVARSAFVHFRDSSTSTSTTSTCTVLVLVVLYRAVTRAARGPRRKAG